MPLSGSLATLLMRGLLAGLVAGIVAATVGYFIGEPHLDAAIALEEAGSASEHGHSDHGESSGGHSHGEGEALVSRTGQKFGQFLALGLAGLALGALYSSVAHVVRRYTSLPGPLLAMVLGAAGWAAIVAVPFFKYPANPPAVGNPDTMNERTLLWLATVLLGIAAVAAAVGAFRVLRGRMLPTLGLIGGVAAFVLVTAVGYIVLPGANEVGTDFPATLLWQFRVASLAQTATLWACLALGFAALTEFSERARTPENRATTSVA
ncbi:CbtA family protein [Nocardia sp. CNY236]|uniref:CbtA family protein n=1 Tax=Nocardia sp. CNY236 TaxID=1169152 RepID=UPI0004213E82|nr:CbtA family protein [Nocardia sp. CNY236]